MEGASLLKLEKLLAETNEVVTVEAGQLIFVRGGESREMYVVVEGAVELKTGEQLLSVAGPGEVFGEMAIIDGSRRSATAIARENSTLIVVNEDRFLDMVRETPFFALHVMRTLAERLRRMTNRLEEQAVETENLNASGL